MTNIRFNHRRGVYIQFYRNMKSGRGYITGHRSGFFPSRSPEQMGGAAAAEDDAGEPSPPPMVVEVVLRTIGPARPTTLRLPSLISVTLTLISLSSLRSRLLVDRSIDWPIVGTHFAGSGSEANGGGGAGAPGGAAEARPPREDPPGQEGRWDRRRCCSARRWGYGDLIFSPQFVVMEIRVEVF